MDNIERDVFDQLAVMGCTFGPDVQQRASSGVNPRGARLHCIGDSITLGANELETGYVGGWRHPMCCQLREWRDDIELIGSFHDVAEAISSSGGWYHNAVGGQTIEAATSSYAGWRASMGENADIVIDCLGTNNIMTGGQSAAQMLVARKALEAAYAAASPAPLVIVLGLPPFVAGTTVGGNLAAWNALRVQYNALLAGYCGSLPGHVYVSLDALGPGEYQPGGVHPNHQGQATIGMLVAQVVNALLGPRRIPSTPRVFRERQPWGSLQLPSNAAAIGATHSGFNPGTGSFAVAFDWYPRLLAGGFQVVAAYNAVASLPDYWGIIQTGKGLEVNFAGIQIGGGVTPSENALQNDRWHRIVLIAYANGSNSSIGLYVNGRLVGLTDAGALWNFGVHAVAFGTAPGQNGVPSFYGNIRAFKGTTIPKPGSIAALRAVEGDYYQAQTLVPGACTASYSLNVNLADDINGNPNLTASGSAALVSAWPAGSPARPWEYPADGNKILTALGGGSAPTLGTIGGLGPATAAQNSWVRMTDATGAVFWVPVWK